MATLLPKPHFFIQDIDDQPIGNFSSGQFILIETFHEEANTLLIKKIALTVSVVHLISILVTDYIQNRRGQALLFSLSDTKFDIKVKV